MQKAVSTYVYVKERLHPGILDGLARSGAQAIEIFAARQHLRAACRRGRQSAATADLQQQLSQRPTTVVPTPYAYTYAYPPVGLGLYLGRPWIYGPPYYYHPYWGPRFYGRWGRRW